jgi:hypothetical protein
MNRTPVLVCLVSLVLAGQLDGASSLAYRIPAVNDPGDPIVVYLDLTSDRTAIASVGSRMTYDAASVTLSTVELGAGAPASWSIIFQDTSVAGQVDVALTDQTAAAATISTPASAEMVKLTFSRIGTNCDQASFAFNAAPPDPGPPAAAFPVNHYVIYVSTTINVETATTAASSGPATGDHRFIRGNVNNRSAHALDIQDIVDLAAATFSGFIPGFDCAAAFDVNNDAGRNIVDIVALVQGIFGTTGFVIPPPTGTPGLGTADGGAIPSVLGCSDGEVCP